MTALWIILGIVAFFALLLALPVRIFLSSVSYTHLTLPTKA